jgi:hypothetical protein
MELFLENWIISNHLDCQKGYFLAIEMRTDNRKIIGSITAVQLRL